MQRIQVREESPTSGSQTTTASPNEGNANEESPVILRLHAVSNPDERRVTWDEEVIDNENMGKKSSKGTPSIQVLFKQIVCCIYHRPRQFGESSSEESSSSSSASSDESSDDMPCRPNGHQRDHPDGGEPCERHVKAKRVEKQKRKLRPNAYERQPHYEKKGDNTAKPDGSGT